MKKRLILWVFALFLAVSPGVWAQSANLHSVDQMIRQQKKQIKTDWKSGKLTQDQARAQMENLKAIRKQELGYLRQNGHKDLTNDQKAQLTLKMNKYTK
jgi:hypothetical protein